MPKTPSLWHTLDQCVTLFSKKSPKADHSKYAQCSVHRKSGNALPMSLRAQRLDSTWQGDVFVCSSASGIQIPKRRAVNPRIIADGQFLLLYWQLEPRASSSAAPPEPRRYRPTRTRSLPDLRYQNATPDFLRNRLVLQTDDSVRGPVLSMLQFSLCSCNNS